MNKSKLQTKVRRIGNGRGVLLSKSICDLIGMDIDDPFMVEVKEGRIILVPWDR